MTKQLITIAGCGPGSPQYITPAVQQAVQQAEVIAGSPRLLDMFGDSPAERISIRGDIASALDKIEAAAETRSIVVLVSGDPGISSLATPVLRRLGRARCRVLPGVSSVQAAFATLGLSWTDARIISLHGRQAQDDPASAADCDKTAVLAGTDEAIQWIARAALETHDTHAVFLCQDLTLPQQRVEELSANMLTTVEAGPLTLAVFVRRNLL
jgi:cobalt-precorrin-7 (C5)-methyltransferase